MSARMDRSQIKTLHVSNLPETVQEVFLKEFLGSTREVEKVTLKMDPVTGKSRCFAFVECKTPEDARVIMAELGYTKMDNKVIYIRLADPNFNGKNTQGNVFIKNLDTEISDGQLHEALEGIGEIASCKICRFRETGESKGYAFVQFVDPEDANKAIEQLQGATISDKCIKIEKYVKKEKLPLKDTFTNVFLRYVPISITNDEELKAFIEGLSPELKVQSPKLIVDAAGNSRGAGYVNMNNHEMAVKLIELVKNIDEHEVINRMGEKEMHKMEAFQGKSRKERDEELRMNQERRRRELYEATKGRNLFFKGFNSKDKNGKPIYEDAPDFKDVAEVKEFFEKYGELERDPYLPTKEDGDFKGFGFVLFKTIDGSNKCMQDFAVNDYFYIGDFIPAASRQAMNLKETKEGRRKAKSQQQSQKQEEQDPIEATPKDKLMEKVLSSNAENKEALIAKAEKYSDEQAQLALDHYDEFVATN